MKSNQPKAKLDEPPGTLSNPSKNTLTIYLYNVVEDEWSFVNAFSDPIHIVKEIDRDESSSDCFFLYQATESDFINVDPNLPGSFPDIEFKIKKNKTIEMLFHGILRVTPQGKYYGMEVNEDIIPSRLQARILDTAYLLEQSLHAIVL